jgi:hypothetical protein
LLLRILAGLALLLLPATAEAASPVTPCAPVMPFTFVNGTVADATQVNTNFSALLTCANNNGRIPINTNIIMSVALAGTDVNNSCLSPIVPCATGNQAIAVLQQSFVFVDCVHTVTISYIGGGSFTQSTLVAGRIPGQCAASQLIFQGNTGSPDSVPVTGTTAYVFSCISGCLMQIQGFELFGANGDALRAYEGGVILLQAIDFNTTISAHIHLDRYGVAQTIGNYSVSGGASNHIWTDGEATYRWFANEVLNPCCSPVGITVTVNGTPAFSNAFVRSIAGLVDARNLTFVNAASATGTQCIITDNGVVRTQTSGTLVFPGTGSSCGTSHGGIFD